MNIDEFLQSKNGKITMIGIMAVFIIGFSYYKIQSFNKKNTSIPKENNIGEIDIKASNKNFQLSKNNYYSEPKKKKEKVNREDDFFNIKENLNNLKQSAKDTITVEDSLSEEEKYQRYADSILQANNNKITTQKVNYKPTGRSYNHRRIQNTHQSRKYNSDNTLKKEQARAESFFTSKFKENTVTNSDKLKTDSTIYVEVNGDQTVTKGERVNLILKKAATVNGINFPKSTTLFGFITFGEHRVFITINNIKHQRIKLKVFDANDGSEGLYSKKNLVGEIENEVVSDQSDDINVGGVKVGSTLKKIFKKKQKTSKITIYNKQELILKIDEN